MPDSTDRKTPLTIGDSIGLIALIAGLTAIIIIPPIWLKILLTIATCVGIVATIRNSHWTHLWSKPAKLIASVFFSTVLVILSGSQINNQLKQADNSTILDYLERSLHPLHAFLLRPPIQRIIWAIIGAISLLLLQILLLAGKAYSAQKGKRRTTDKGFLDYKLQTETAIKDLTPALGAITQVAAQVGKAITKQAELTKAAAMKSTHEQLRVVRVGARALNKYSLQLNKRCLRLEKIGVNLTEGQVGWFRWMHSLPSSRATFDAVRPSLIGLCNSIDKGIHQSARYIALLESSKGVSQDMNAALDQHIQAMRRVQRANTTIRDSCREALNLTLPDDHQKNSAADTDQPLPA